MLGADRQVETEGHLHQINGLGADEGPEKDAEKQKSKSIHGKGLDAPVDEEGQQDRLNAPARPDDAGEIDLHHDRVHHEKRQMAMGMETIGAPFTLIDMASRFLARSGATLPSRMPPIIQSPTQRVR